MKGRKSTGIQEKQPFENIIPQSYERKKRLQKGLHHFSTEKAGNGEQKRIWPGNYGVYAQKRR